MKIKKLLIGLMLALPMVAVTVLQRVMHVAANPVRGARACCLVAKLLVCVPSKPTLRDPFDSNGSRVI